MVAGGKDFPERESKAVGLAGWPGCAFLRLRREASVRGLRGREEKGDQKELSRGTGGEGRGGGRKEGRSFDLV